MTNLNESKSVEMPSVNEFRTGLSLLPGGVSVITTDGEAGLAGFTASAVCSVTDSPPTVLVCMNRSSFAHHFFTSNRVLCVNVLSAEQKHLSAMFSDKTIEMRHRFERCAWQTLATGAPALDEVLVSLDGEIVSIHDVGTHSVFIVELRSIRSSATEQTPLGLAYFNRSYHALQSGN